MVIIVLEEDGANVKFRSIWTQINQDTGSFPCEFTDQCNEKRQAPSWLSLMELLGHFSSFPASNSADKNILTTFLLLPWFFFIAQLPVIINSLFFLSFHCIRPSRFIIFVVSGNIMVNYCSRISIKFSISLIKRSLWNLAVVEISFCVKL